MYDSFVYATATPRDARDVARIWQRAEHVLSPHDPDLAPHALVVTPAVVDRLRADGVPIAIENIDVQQMVDDSYRRNDTPAAAAPNAVFGDWFDKVQELDAIESYLADLTGTAGSHAKVVDIGKSIQGRNIHAVLISSNPDDSSRATIITTGTHHAREWLTPMVAMAIIDGLVHQYASDPKVKHVVDNLNVYVVPVLNPDGYVLTFNGNRMQRRNLHPGCNVDLNRNYPTAFGMGVADSCSSDTNSGAMPFSEPETQAIQALATAQSKIRLYVDYHSNANQVMIPYAYTQTPPPNFAKNQAWGTLLGTAAMVPVKPGYAIAHGQGGGALDWFRETYAESLVVELPGNGFDPPSNGVNANVELEWNGWLAVADAVAGENPAGNSGGAVDAGQGGAGGAGGGSPRDASDGEASRGGAAGSSASATGAGGLATGASSTSIGIGGGPGGGAGGAATGGAGGNWGGSGGRYQLDAGPTSGRPGGPSSTDVSAGCSCRMMKAPGPRRSETFSASLMIGLVTLLRRRAKRTR